MPSLDAILTGPAALPAELSAEKNRRALELRLWLTLLVLVNLGLLLGKVPATPLMFDPAAVAAGQWWRVGTWPWAHVSRYHLLLDGVAFLLLYQGLAESSSLARFGYVVGAATGSLLLPLACSPEVGRLGLCGLSGPAHGLMAISALELLGNHRQRRLGAWLLVGLLAKTAWELWSGTAFLQGWHLGDIGHPIVTTHAGGVVGGLTAFAIRRRKGDLV